MDRYGILARGEATTSWADLYTCPETAELTYDSNNITVRPQAATRQASTLISSIVICRLAANGVAAEWISIAVVDSPGTSVTDSDYIFYQHDVAGGTTEVVGISMTLAPGETIRIISEANNSINVILNGVEVS